MRILIDTHILIWHVEGDEQLSSESRQLITDPTNDVFVSIASFWEIAIKSSRGKLTLSKPIATIIDEVETSSASILPIETRHTTRVAELPFHHNDPFDRMIIAQAIVEDISILSVDKNFSAYGAELL